MTIMTIDYASWAALSSPAQSSQGDLAPTSHLHDYMTMFVNITYVCIDLASP